MQSIKDENFEYDLEEAVLEASKCMSCKMPNCSKNCPLNVNVKKILKHIKEYDIISAYDELTKKNVLAEFSCHVCKIYGFCTNSCMVGKTRVNKLFTYKLKNPIDIPALEEFVMTRVRETDSINKSLRDSVNKRVAILGTNATAIACAFVLARNGFFVTMYEETNEFAGKLMNMYTNNKKIKNVLNLYENDLRKLNVIIIKNALIGRDYSVEVLKKENDYLVLTTDLGENEEINISGVTECINHPLNNKLHLITYSKDIVNIPSKENVFNKSDKILIIGGNKAVFEKSKIMTRYSDNVFIFLDKDEKYFSKYKEDLENIRTLGVDVNFSYRPVKVVEKDRKIFVTFVKTKLIKNEDMQEEIVDIFDTEEILECDKLVLENTSFERLKSELNEVYGISLNKNMKIYTDSKYLASLNGTIYAGGDLIEENKTILDNIKVGMVIANSIINENGGEYNEFVDEINEIMRKQEYEKKTSK